MLGFGASTRVEKLILIHQHTYIRNREVDTRVLKSRQPVGE